MLIICVITRISTFVFSSVFTVEKLYHRYLTPVLILPRSSTVRILGSQRSASRLFIFIGLTSSLARILSGKLCNNPTINPLFVYQLSLFIGGVSVLLLPYATKYWALVVFSCAYGASDGIFISTANYILLSCVDEKRKTAAFYIECLLYSFSVATGGPIAGKTFSRQICRGTLLRLPKPITSELSTISFTCICYPRIYFTLRKDMDISYLTL